MSDKTNAESPYTTTDKNITLLLLVAKIPIMHSSKDEHDKTVFAFDRKLAEPWINMHRQRKLPKFEFEDMITALNLFNSIVHSR